MKKITLLVLTVAIVLSMSLSAFANVDFTIAAEGSVVGLGTTSATVTYTITGTKAIGMTTLMVKIPTGLTLASVDVSDYASNYDTTAYDENNLDIGQILPYEDDMSTVLTSGSAKIVLNFTIADSSVAASYEVGLDEGTGIIDPDANDYVLSEFPKATITVGAAAPADTEFKFTVEGGDPAELTRDAEVVDKNLGKIKIAKIDFTADKSKGEVVNGIVFSFRVEKAPAKIVGYRWIVKTGDQAYKGTKPVNFGTAIDKDSQILIADAYDNGITGVGGVTAVGENDYDIVMKTEAGDFIYTNGSKFADVE